MLLLSSLEELIGVNQLSAKPTSFTHIIILFRMFVYILSLSTYWYFFYHSYLNHLFLYSSSYVSLIFQYRGFPLKDICFYLFSFVFSCSRHPFISLTVDNFICFHKVDDNVSIKQRDHTQSCSLACCKYGNLTSLDILGLQTYRH